MNKYSATFLAYLYNYIEKSKLASDLSMVMVMVFNATFNNIHTQIAG
jgi:hypothetical protein